MFGFLKRKKPVMTQEELAVQLSQLISLSRNGKRKPALMVAECDLVAKYLEQNGCAYGASIFRVGVSLFFMGAKHSTVTPDPDHVERLAKYYAEEKALLPEPDAIIEGADVVKIEEVVSYADDGELVDHE